MQSNVNGGKENTTARFTSSYLQSSKPSTSGLEYQTDCNHQWNNSNSLSSSDSSGSWSQDGGLPPPPQECQVELRIKPASIPSQPAMPDWANDNSDDASSNEDGKQTGNSILNHEQHSKEVIAYFL